VTILRGRFGAHADIEPFGLGIAALAAGDPELTPSLLKRQPRAATKVEAHVNGELGR
jgi:hypothetical protein